METLRKLQDRVQNRLRRTSFGGGGGGARFFSSVKRGESAELAADLNSLDRDRQRNAIKRIIANMTLGRDVSQLFVDVVKLSHTYNVETKKLVYLYIVNNARLQPDKALLAVNTFLQDAAHPSPIIRALALRTVLCLRVDCVAEYTLEPLRRAAMDPDPYVRKTAAIGIIKAFHVSPKSFWEDKLDSELLRLLDDPYPVVASNAAAAVAEINTYSGGRQLRVSHEIIHRLLNSMADASEWGQCHILELIASYIPHNSTEADVLLERLIPRLGHSNPAVVMSTARVLAQLSNRCKSTHEITPRIESALLTLLGQSDPESVYVVLRNVPLLLTSFPSLMCDRIEAFFIRFTDSPAVKLEKLRLLLRLTTSATASTVMKELREYCRSEVDTSFLTEVVLTAARATTKVPVVASDGVLLIKDAVQHHPTLLSAVVVSLKDVARSYPDLVPMRDLFEWGADTLTDDDGRVSLLWLVGELGGGTEGDELLARNVQDVLLESPAVQLATLTAVIKSFLRDPTRFEALLQNALEALSESSLHPDVRDRATVYVRMLSHGLGVATMAAIVHGQRPPTDVDRLPCDAMTPSEQLGCINTAAAVFARPFRTFTTSYGYAGGEDGDISDDEVGVMGSDIPAPAANIPQSQAGFGAANPSVGTPTASIPTTSTTAARSHADPFGDIFDAPPQAAPAAAGGTKAGPRTVDHGKSSPTPPPPARSTIDDLFAPAAPPPTAVTSSSDVAVRQVSLVNPANRVHAENGVEIYARIDVDAATLSLALKNLDANTPVSELALQFNVNAMGLMPNAPLAGVLRPSQFVPPRESCTAELPLRFAVGNLRNNGGAGTTMASSTTTREVEVGVRSSRGMARFRLVVPTAAVFAPSEPMERSSFSRRWMGMEEGAEQRVLIGAQLASAIASVTSANDLPTVLAREGRLYIVAVVSKDLQVMYYGNAQHRLGYAILFELVVYTHTPSSSYASVKCSQVGDAVSMVVGVLTDAMASVAAPPPPVVSSSTSKGNPMDDWFA